MAGPGAFDGAALSGLVPPVLQEAVSTGDPEMVQLVLQYRDYQRATQRLAGIPELLNKLRQVRLGTGVWPDRRGGEPRQGAVTDCMAVRSLWSPATRYSLGLRSRLSHHCRRRPSLSQPQSRVM